MNEEQKKEIATFRFSVIGDLTGGMRLEKGELDKLIKEKAKCSWNIPYSDRTGLSESTIRRWATRYKVQNEEIEALYPKDRDDKGSSRAIDDETGSALLQLKEKYPDAGIPELIYQMEKRDLSAAKTNLRPSTVYRFFHQNGGLKKATTKVDRRRFEAEFPNDLWQTDVMHGPKVLVGGKLKKTYLIAFIDDHSRLVPHGLFYLSETTKAFLSALKTAVVVRGLPRKLYADNGSAFRSKHLEFVTASLQISLIHAKPYSPQGKGKIERFFKSVRSGVLTTWEGDGLEDLNECFLHWLKYRYHRRIHSSTGETPLDRFKKNMELLRAAPMNLTNHFRNVVIRKVTKDRIVSLEGNLYEAPMDLIGEKIELLYHPDDLSQLEARYKGKSYGFLTKVDLGANIRVRREKNEGEVGLEDQREEESPISGEMF